MSLADDDDSLLSALDGDMMDLIDGKVSLQQVRSQSPPSSRGSVVHVRSEPSPVELVLFYGPPCSAKTAYYHENLVDQHTRISPSESFRQPNLSFHRLIAQASEHLQNHENVVIDDDNTLPRTRASYIKSVRDLQKAGKLGAVHIKVICFQPLGGIYQCLWANEWAMAQHTTCIDGIEKDPGDAPAYTPKSQELFEEWFYNTTTPPCKEEGFDEIQTVHSKICCYDTLSLDKRALFIDAAAMFEFVKTDKENAEVAERKLTLLDASKRNYQTAIQQFLDVYPGSVVVVLVDENSFFPMVLEMEPNLESQQISIIQWRSALQEYLTTWSTLIQQPIFHVTAAYGAMESSSFFSFPNPGMVAYAQYIHQIELQQSVYVSDDATSPCLGETLGLPSVITGKHFFAESGWSMESKLRKFSTSYAEQSMDYAFLDSVVYPDTYRSQETIQQFQDQAMSGIGRMHGICTPSFTLADLEVEEDEDSEENFPRPRPIAVQSQPEDSDLAPTPFSPSVDPPSASAPESEPPALSEAYVRTLVPPEIFNRGLQYHEYDTIFNRRRQGFQITGMCKGSSAPPYGLTVVLSQQAKRIRTATCTCPIGSGRCKHVVAFLLSWVNFPSKFKVQPLLLDDESGGLLPASPVPPTPIKAKNLNASPLQKIQKNQEPETTSTDKQKTPNGKRKLPPWLQAASNDTPSKRIKKEPKTSQKKTQNSRPTTSAPSSDAPSSTRHQKDEPTAPAVPISASPIKAVPLRTVKEILADLDRELEQEITLEDSSSSREGSPRPSLMQEAGDSSLVHENCGEK